MTEKKGTDPYVTLAKQSLEYFVIHGEFLPMPQGLPSAMVNTCAGCFVSLKIAGQLRGCIGTILPTKPSLAQEIISNAVSAGIYDPRFPRVEKEELDQLTYSVDILKKPEKIHSMAELDVKRYGVIVTSGYRRGLLLPNLEGVDTVDEQVRIALAKAGIYEDETYEMERFEVIRHQ